MLAIEDVVILDHAEFGKILREACPSQTKADATDKNIQMTIETC